MCSHGRQAGPQELSRKIQICSYIQPPARHSKAADRGVCSHGRSPKALFARTNEQSIFSDILLRMVRLLTGVCAAMAGRRPQDLKVVIMDAPRTREECYALRLRSVLQDFHQQAAILRDMVSRALDGGSVRLAGSMGSVALAAGLRLHIMP